MSVATTGGLVESDHSISNQFPINAKGATVEVGTDGGIPVFATFNDNAKGSENSGNRLNFEPALLRPNGRIWRKPVSPLSVTGCFFQIFGTRWIENVINENIAAGPIGAKV